MSTLELQIFHRNMIFAMALGKHLGIFPKYWNFSSEKREVVFRSKT
jgi:hypothetical protein